MRLPAHRPTVIVAGARVSRSRRPARRSLSSTSITPIAPSAATGLRYWRPFPREMLDVICCETVSDALPVRTHDAVQLLLVGSPVVVSDGSRADLIVRPGQVLLAAPQALNGARSLDGRRCVMRALLVAPAALAGLGSASAQALSRASDGEYLVVDDAATYAELWRLIDDLRRPLAAAHDVSRLLECFARLLTAGFEPPPDHFPRSPLARCGPGVARVRDYLLAHVGESLSLEELADVAGLSKHYLLRAFRRAYGATPHEFQMRLRLGLAWRMIVDGVSLTRATYDAGFADQSHLTRRFSAAFGLPPARYARMLVVPPAARSDSVDARVAISDWPAAPRSAA